MNSDRLPVAAERKGTPSRHYLPEGGTDRAAAASLLARERARLPDLTAVTVVLPNLHAAQRFGQVLCEASGLPVLLLPRLTTLAAWAEEVPSGRAVLPQSRREAELYQALLERDWFPGADLWTLAAELAGLFDELTANLVELPESAEQFALRLEAAYQARGSAPLAFEARLVHELWYAAARHDDREIDPGADYHCRLTALAQGARGPLYAVGLAGLTRAEEVFFEAYARRHPVYRLEVRGEGPLAELLAAAWQPRSGDAARGAPEDVSDLFAPCVPRDRAAPLKLRAEAFLRQQPASPLDGRLALFPALSLEQEAQAIDLQVRQWLLDGERDIAVVVQDRLVARRARALLERAGVLVRDETGWTFSTVAAATVVMRWLDTLSSHYYHRELLDLLKSPYVLADWPAERRKQAVYGLERLVRERSIASGLEQMAARAANAPGLEDTVALLDRLAQADRSFPRGNRTLAAWLAGLRDSLTALGVMAGLGQDDAGAQLMDLLARLERELAPHGAVYGYAAWRRWLNHRLEAATFRDRGIDSPVVFTHLSNTRLRSFHAAIVAGADAAHFPGRGDAGVFFNQSVRAQLGLPTFERELEIAQADLSALIGACTSVLVTWQAQKGAEPNMLSPWLERLSTFHSLAWGDDLVRGGLAALLPHARVTPPPGAAPGADLHAAPSPALAASLVPSAASASGYNSLLACPYQFYARYGLRLGETEEVQEAVEKRDYGEYVHRILREFHEQRPALVGVEREVLTGELEAVSARVFVEAGRINYLARAWAMRWHEMIPAYIDWQLAREAEGWRVADGELAKACLLELGDGRELKLHGRIDRVDRRSAPGAPASVVDYKVQDPGALRRRLEQPGEDVQLPVYALLLGEPVEDAFYLGLDREVKTVPLGEVDDLSQAVLDRLIDLFRALHAGAGLPAHGTIATCQYCEARGLCRRDYWQSA